MCVAGQGRIQLGGLLLPGRLPRSIDRGQTVRKRNTRIMYDRPTAYGWSVGISTQRPVDSEMSGEIGKTKKDAS